MEFFKDRMKQFQKKHHAPNQSLYKKLKLGQDPKILLVTCSDSRILPEQLFQAKPGELFTIRNAGNIIPAMPDNGGESATIEYALKALNIDHIIICGHTHCGAMTGLLNPKSIENLPIVQKWLKHGPSQEKFIDFAKEQTKELKLQKLIAANVVTQLEHIKSHPGYQSLIKKKEVHLHGLVYDFETGSILNYDKNSNRFNYLVEPNNHITETKSTFC